MIDLTPEVIAWLVASAAAGLIVGFGLAQALGRPARTTAASVAAREHELEALVADLRHEKSTKEREVAWLGEQLEELRRALESGPEDEDADETDDDTEELVATLREQVDDLRSERDDRARELHEAAEQNASLRRLLDETADRLVELERQRMQVQGPPAQAPARPSPARAAVPLDPAVPRERERDALDLDVEKSSPLHVGRTTDAATTTLEKDLRTELPAAEPPPAVPEPSADAPSAPEPPTDAGHEKPLTEIASIPQHVTERLALIGAATNLQLLRKAGAPTRRNAMATSMRLDPEELVRYVHRADLIRVGMRDEDVTRLVEAGVRSLEALAQAKGDALSNRLQSVSKRGAGRDGAPEAPTVARWIERAKGLPTLVEV